jgi:hypothetical protein
MVDQKGDRPADAARTGRWKYYRLRLFDLEHDPGETVNVLLDHQELAAALADHLDGLRGHGGIGAGGTVTLDPESASELEALGYL